MATLSPQSRIFITNMHDTQCIMNKAVELNQPVSIQPSSKKIHIYGLLQHAFYTV